MSRSEEELRAWRKLCKKTVAKGVTVDDLVMLGRTKAEIAEKTGEEPDYQLYDSLEWGELLEMMGKEEYKKLGLVFSCKTKTMEQKQMCKYMFCDYDTDDLMLKYTTALVTNNTSNLEAYRDIVDVSYVVRATIEHLYWNTPSNLHAWENAEKLLALARV
jgi:hypothetical protein